MTNSTNQPDETFEIQANLHTKILSRLDNQKPYSHLRYRIIWIILVILTVLLSFIAVFCMAFFIWDINYTLNKIPINGNSFVDILQNGLFELMLVSVLLSVIMYVMYRRTDLPFVKQRLSVFLGILLGVGLFATVGFFVIDNSPIIKPNIIKLEEKLEKLPHRPNRQQRLLNRRMPKNPPPKIIIERIAP
jgi:glucan phosphoethanolaminetransferase (alkaline phosphatase superfamily)